MSEVIHPPDVDADTAAFIARTREDVAVGGEIIRHRLSSRVMHWCVAISFVVCILTGMPIWTPIFAWMATLVGGLQVCRWLHPYAGVAFFAGCLWMGFHWAKEMVLSALDKKWLNPLALAKYMNHADSDPETGKYNGGQKLFFWTALIGAVLLFATGFILWWPDWFPQLLREGSVVLHDLVFIGAAVAVIGHVYLGSSAYPGTFSSMVRGTVSKAWARLHHPKWYRDVTGERDR